MSQIPYDYFRQNDALAEAVKKVQNVNENERTIEQKVLSAYGAQFLNELPRELQEEVLRKVAEEKTETKEIKPGVYISKTTGITPEDSKKAWKKGNEARKSLAASAKERLKNDPGVKAHKAKDVVKEESIEEGLSSHAKKQGYRVQAGEQRYTDYDGRVSSAPNGKKYIEKYKNDYESDPVGSDKGYTDARKAKRAVNRIMKGKLEEISKEKAEKYLEKAEKDSEKEESVEKSRRRAKGIELAKKKIEKLSEESELSKGIKDEKNEHGKSVVKQIAKDHLKKDPDYYSKLEKAGLDEEAKLGTGARFDKLAKKVHSKKLAAWIGMKKYGKKGMENLAHKHHLEENNEK